MDPSVFPWQEAFLAEFEETVLARESLPTLRGNPVWIVSALGASTTDASSNIRTRRISLAREVEVGRHQRKSGFVAVLNTIAVQVKEGLGVDIRLPLVHGKLSQIGA